MSALNVFVIGDQVHLVTDGAGFAGGRLIALTPKAHPLPHLGVAVGFRGHIAITNQIRFHVQNFATFDALMSDAPAELKRLHGRRRKLLRKLLPGMFDYDMAVAGFADGRPFACLFSTVERPDLPAFTWAPVPFLLCLPQIDHSTLRHLADGLSHDFDESAAAIMDEQRRTGDTLVGGYAQVTSVGRQGITTRLLKRYPDHRWQIIDRAKTRAGSDAVALKKSTDWRDE